MPVPWQVGHMICPVPLHFGHTAANAEPKHEKDNSPINRIVNNLLFMSLNFPKACLMPKRLLLG
jgi:hypothetical protein